MLAEDFSRVLDQPGVNFIRRVLAHGLDRTQQHCQSYDEPGNSVKRASAIARSHLLSCSA
jgi:hypothetical protein